MAGPKINFRRRLPISGSLRSEGTSGDGRHDRDLVLLLNRGPESSPKPNVFVVQIDVDEPTKLALLVEQPVPEAWIAGVQGSDRRGEVGALDVNGHLAVGQTAEWAWDAKLRHS